MTSPTPPQPVVAIVGRPNVGKSALFNRLARRQISLVFDRPGTTRDRLVTPCQWENYRYELIDTGGIGMEEDQAFSQAIRHEAEIALTLATDILFVVDAREGLTTLDKELAHKLRRASCRIFVVANKIDAPEKQAYSETEFTSLGFGNPFPVSAAHGHGVSHLIETLTQKWAPAVDASLPRPSPLTRLTFCGRPNVGKSSLINALLEDQRAIVSEIPGTTRDALDIEFTWNDHRYLLIDTAGMRKKRRVHDSLEQAMTGRSAHAINRADVCLLVIDADNGVQMQDKKIAGLIGKAFRPCIIIVNKWDKARALGDGGKAAERTFYSNIRNDLFFLDHAPVLFLSAKTGERVPGLMQTIQIIEKNQKRTFPTGPLNRTVQEILQKTPPRLTKGKPFKIFYASQFFDERRKERQIPTLLFFCNDPSLLIPSYRRYLELQLRQHYDLTGCPLKMLFRSRRDSSN